MKGSMAVVRVLIGCALFLCSLGARRAQAVPIVANFDEGNSAAEVDAYPGKAGDGWMNAWAAGFQSGDDSTFDQTVIDTAPLLAGTGDYLSLAYTNRRKSARSAHIERRFDLAEIGGSVFEVEFLFRMDTDPAGDDFGVFFFSGNNTSSPIFQRPSTATSPRPATWGLWAESTITFIDGVEDLETYNYVDSGITLVQDNVYHFRFVVDTSAQTYVAAVSNLTANVGYVSDTLAFGETYDPGEGESYNANKLAWSLRTASRNFDPLIMQASLDSIVIIPEPSTAVGLLLAAWALSGAVRRRR